MPNLEAVCQLAFGLLYLQTQFVYNMVDFELKLLHIGMENSE